jgi:putative transposase
MVRALRIEVPDGLYQVHTRGNNRQDIYFGNWSGRLHIRELTRVARRQGWLRDFNGQFARVSNRILGRTGHMFGERFTSHLIESDEYLLEAVRYTLLNPVRSAGVRDPRHWRNSSLRSTLGLELPRPYLDIDWLLGQFGKKPSSSRRAFLAFVLDGIGKPLTLPSPEVVMP